MTRARLHDVPREPHGPPLSMEQQLRDEAEALEAECAELRQELTDTRCRLAEVVADHATLQQSVALGLRVLSALTRTEPER